MIYYQVQACIKAIEELIIVEDYNNNALKEWFTQNPNLILFIKSSSNKLSSIPRLIPTSSATTNQVGSLSISSNNVNIRRSARQNAFIKDSAIENKEIGESNEDAKVDLKIQPNIVIIAPIFDQPITATGMLMPSFFFSIFVCRQLTLIYNGKLLLFQVKFSFYGPHKESVTLSIFSKTIRIYQYINGFLRQIIQMIIRGAIVVWVYQIQCLGIENLVF